MVVAELKAENGLLRLVLAWQDNQPGEHWIRGEVEARCGPFRTAIPLEFEQAELEGLAEDFRLAVDRDGAQASFRNYGGELSLDLSRSRWGSFACACRISDFMGNAQLAFTLGCVDPESLLNFCKSLVAAISQD